MKKLLLLPILLALSLTINAQYEKIDDHVKTVKVERKDKIEDIAKKITAISTTEEEKVRAIFSWITLNVDYDVSAFMAGRQPNSNPMNVVRTGKAVCQGYSNLFEALAAAVEIEAYVVSGFSKGYGFSQRKKLENADHAWNAVKINGKWHLIDATWGAGYLNQKGIYVASLQEEYFLSKPEYFIGRHLPEDPAFQMLPCPITPKEFLKDTAEVRQLAAKKDQCYSFADTLNTYSQLDSLQKRIATAKRMVRYFPENTLTPAMLINQAAYHYSIPLNDPEIPLKEKKELAQKSLTYYTIAKKIIDKGSGANERQLKRMIDKNLENVQKFIEFYENN
ncbi:MAG: transglutaminase domain-containing protein [Salinivirgaceae bacterium]